MGRGATSSLAWRAESILWEYPDRYLLASDDVGSARFVQVWLGPSIYPAELSAAIKTYYGMMGWDECGVPRPETLQSLGIGWALEKMM